MNTMSDEEYVAFREKSSITRMNIVQRATFTNLSKCSKTTTLAGTNDGLVKLDYMGASEYEWGAVPFSMCIIMHEMEENRYELTKSSLTDDDGKRVWIFCDKDKIHDTEEELKLYLAENSPELITSYRLHEGISFQYYFMQHRFDSWKRGDNFWWDLRNHFMFFIGGSGYATWFLNAIQCDYDDWWMKSHTNEKRQTLYDEAIQHQH